MSITFSSRGDFSKTFTMLRKMEKTDFSRALHSAGQKGVSALAAATPTDTGKTAASWDYTISIKNGGGVVTWTNSHINKGVPIAIVLQYGHGTGTGGYVQGRDYINPAMKPIFDGILNDLKGVLDG